MFIIHGKRSARIRSFEDHQQRCTQCNNFGLRISIRQEYYHMWYIPFTTIGDKEVHMRCLDCDSPVRHQDLQREYARKTRTPLYLYALPILLIAAIGTVVIRLLMNG